MALISLGDMTQTFMLRRLTAGTKQEAQVAAQELTTGRSADISQKLRGELSNLTGVEASLMRLKGYRAATDSAALKATTMQSVFSHIDRVTDGIGVSLLSASMMDGTQTLDALAKEVAQKLDSVLTALNTKVGDSSLFAGIANDGPAIASSEAILTALEAFIGGAGSVTATDIEASVTAWFQSPTGFTAVGYLGAGGANPVAISAEDRVDLAFTADDPALRDTIKSLTLVALVSRGTVVPDASTANELAQMAGNSFLQTHSDRALLSGRLGHAQARIDQAQTRNIAEESALLLARSDLFSVDPYEAATRLEEAQNQLETLYSVTARLSRLRLVDFLR